MEIIKTKNINYKISQVVLDCFEFNEKFKEIRSSHKYKGFKCFICNKSFEMGEKISLIITNKGNKTVCNYCAEKIKSELDN